MVEFAVNTFTEICEMAIPIAMVWEIGILIISTFMRVAFGGRLWLGK